MHYFQSAVLTHFCQSIGFVLQISVSYEAFFVAGISVPSQVKIRSTIRIISQEDQIFPVAYSEPPHMLTPFQRWTLLHLHNSEAGSTGLGILKACCITAMTENFQKKDAVEGLAKLEKMGLVSRRQPAIRNPAHADPELSDSYFITADGVIYTKKMLKPVLDLLGDPERAEKMAQRLSDGKTKGWLRTMAKSTSGIIQQQILERIIVYGLGNISGLGQLLDLLRKSMAAHS